MHCSLAFLLSVCALATAAPPSPKDRAKWMAEQLGVKINHNFIIPPLLTTAPPSGEQYGAASLVLILKGYNSLIPDTFNGGPDVKADIESLYRFVDQWRQRNCGEKPQPQAPRALMELRNRRKDSISITYAALYRVGEYLKNLLKNLEQLETCT